MPKQRQPDFDCPVCGETVPGGSKSCPECGACEKSGWSDDSYLDGVSLPDDPAESDESRGHPARDRTARLWPWVAGILLVVTLWMLLH
jgi:predicted nucleic acid-binding Zn ribbon protein